MANITLVAHPEVKSTGKPAVRTLSTTMWLILVAVINFGYGLLLFMFEIGSSYSLSVFIIGLAFWGVVAGIILLFLWKKIGFWISAACSAGVVLLELILGGDFLISLFMVLVLIGILYIFLQFPRENRAWSHLR